jgi:hypothetical protein
MAHVQVAVEAAHFIGVPFIVEVRFLALVGELDREEVRMALQT